MPPLPTAAWIELEAVEFPAVLALVRRGARTQAGAQRVGQIHPWDKGAALRRLRQVELEGVWAARPEALPVVAFDEALRELLNPAGWLLPEHWRQLRDGLQALDRLLGSIAGIPCPEERAAPAGTHLGIDRLQVTAELLPSPAPLRDLLARSFNEDGELDPARIPALAERYRARQQAFQAVQGKLQKTLRQVPEAFQDASIVERNGRYCLPVRSDRRTQVAGLVLDRSGTGATLFLEPFEAVPLNNDYVEADRDFTQAVQAFLRELLETLRQHREAFEKWRDFQGEVDEILALLRWARQCEGRLPDLGEGDLRLVEARHPLLMAGVRSALELEPLGHSVIPLNLHQAADRPGLVISGSNTGGKTVVLKTVGLLWSLAAAGLAAPLAEGSRFPPLPTLHADIGDHQTLLGSLSTFSSHVVHLRDLLRQAKPGGLVLLDELGTGTDPKEGAALGIALLEALNRRGCWVLCSTHLGEISQWALNSKRFQNASVQFDEEKLEPTYRLLVGLPGQSRALTIARRLGLQTHVLDRAEKVLGRREQDWREFLRQLEADRLRLLQQGEVLDQREARLDKDRRILQQREEQLRAAQDKLHREDREKVQRVLEFLDHEGKRLVKELKTKAKQQVEADRLGTDIHQRVKTLEEIAHLELKAQAPQGKTEAALPLKVGAFARHRGLGLEGRVSAMKGDRVTLETPQGRRFEARIGELEPLRTREAEATRKGAVRVRVEAEDIDSELHLIGRASDEVDTEIHRFVERAVGNGAKFIRIVHGHGTGRLKAAVRAALKGHPGIARIEDAPQAQGGAGATLVTLR
jgi:DNA mismatch repair protein MutS2